MAEIRYHLDEHGDSAIAVGLLRRGIDVTTTVEMDLLNASDPEQLASALGKQQVFVTRDRRILGSVGQGNSHAGIVIIRTGRGTIGTTVHA